MVFGLALRIRALGGPGVGFLINCLDCAGIVGKVTGCFSKGFAGSKECDASSLKGREQGFQWVTGGAVKGNEKSNCSRCRIHVFKWVKVL